MMSVSCFVFVCFLFFFVFLFFFFFGGGAGACWLVLLLGDDYKGTNTPATPVIYSHGYDLLTWFQTATRGPLLGAPFRAVDRPT